MLYYTQVYSRLGICIGDTWNNSESICFVCSLSFLALGPAVPDSLGTVDKLGKEDFDVFAAAKLALKAFHVVRLS